MSISFRITRWHAASARLNTPEHWQAWAKGELDAATLPESRPDLAFLPAILRRRLSPAARLMFDAAHQVTEGVHCPTVLVSHDGELNRSFDLWQTLLKEHSVSPTSFGLSVHNALVGQWSMLQGDTSEHTALAARESGWELAFLEAAAMLEEGCGRVLVLAVDYPLANDIPAACRRAPFPYAVAALIEAGNGWTLERRTPAGQNGDYWGALQWAKQMWAGQTDFCNPYTDHAWQWHTTP
ncbi:beta-ketoacyl synthase chain length factor [Neisseria lisongii]|uniref:Beta-ketoacyl synthase chain length factor n=1 Tax=Neisseria lisongii TaxID=2912188 RepID=A0AAW5AQF2_9NEIS|nr:beta-ketoacyl synthase chain length factor [Neisseria lisongii]MCF7529240.1 beta-ketoacyl synthase chain length factor [Neisseria lisongii]